MVIKGFIQLFNTKWSNTNLHYSKSAYSSYATALVLCETWTNLSEHSRQLLQLTAKAIPEGPLRVQPWPWAHCTPMESLQLHTRAQGWQWLLGTQPTLSPPNTQHWPALHSPSLSGHGHRLHTASPLCSPNKTRASIAQPATHQGAREMWAPLKMVFSQLSVTDKLEVNVDKLN